VADPGDKKRRATYQDVPPPAGTRASEAALDYEYEL
jgi:hypothetical protein